MGQETELKLPKRSSFHLATPLEEIPWCDDDDGPLDPTYMEEICEDSDDYDSGADSDEEDDCLCSDSDDSGCDDE